MVSERKSPAVAVLGAMAMASGMPVDLVKSTEPWRAPPQSYGRFRPHTANDDRAFAKRKATRRRRRKDAKAARRRNR